VAREARKINYMRLDQFHRSWSRGPYPGARITRVVRGILSKGRSVFREFVLRVFVL
jgi:hypothetical protein